ncbi:unnamed protein product [Symbiodinium pilosum]|uniref:Uncharacterized protein n=1 Tax=Symbiodinium pilosum TaxID=2952 RepID=A0A812IT75_SYMPI|nr:unnamed protein product [Symbiodinium pilosum]
MAEQAQSSGGDGQAIQTFQAQRVLTHSPAVKAVQEMYWRERASNKRGPPTPVASSSTTPQEAATAIPDLSTPTLVQPWSLQDHTASQLVAAEFGVDVNKQASVDEWLSAPVQTNKDVMAIVRNYHAKVIRPEMYHLVLQVETALGKLSDELFHTRQELAWMASDNRLQQKQHCALQIISSGWPQGMGPDGRAFMIGWMLQQVRKIRSFLEDRGHIDELSEDHTARWMNVFSVEPVTIPQGSEWWSGMTLLTFKSFDLRSAFLERFGGQGRLEITPPMKTAMAANPVNIDATEPDLWSECWNNIIWGTQYDLDQAEAAAFKEAKDHTAVSGKGINPGKTRRHWSNTLVHNDYYCPYPFPLDVCIVEQIAFCWDEYCQKVGKADECIGDLGVATFQGKPPLPTKEHEKKDASGDIAMGPPTTPPTKTVPRAAKSTAAPSKQKGKGRGS